MPKVFLSGYAKLPDNTTAQKLYSHLVLVVTAEMPGGIIQDADCTMATELGRRFIRELLTGYALQTCIKGICLQFGELNRAAAKQSG